MDIIANVLTFIVILIGLYFTYQLINLFVTIKRARKEDSSLQFCLTTVGKAFYIGITVLALIVIGITIYVLIYGIKHDNVTIFRNCIAVIALTFIVYTMQMINIVLVGKKNMMVGRMLIDYRKMKKVDITYGNEMTFIFGQKTYKISTRFVELTTLRKAISRRR